MFLYVFVCVCVCVRVCVCVSVCLYLCKHYSQWQADLLHSNKNFLRAGNLSPVECVKQKQSGSRGREGSQKRGALAKVCANKADTKVLIQN